LGNGRPDPIPGTANPSTNARKLITTSLPTIKTAATVSALCSLILKTNQTKAEAIKKYTTSLATKSTSVSANPKMLIPSVNSKHANAALPGDALSRSRNHRLKCIIATEAKK
jgi:hypothetical protein